MRLNGLLGGAAVVAGLATLTGCPSSRTAQTRPTPGQHGDPAVVTPSNAATATFQAAQDAQAQGRTSDAVGLCQALLKQYPNAPEVPDSLLLLARGALLLEQRDVARKALEELALNHPTRPAAKDAKMLLASMDLEDGRTQEGVSGMRSALDQMPASERGAMSRKMGKAMFDAGQYAGALLPLATAEAATQNAAEKQELQQWMLQIVDGHLRFQEVLALREQVPAGPGYARNLLGLKLARIYLHLGEDTRAIEELSLIHI